MADTSSRNAQPFRYWLNNGFDEPLGKYLPFPGSLNNRFTRRPEVKSGSSVSDSGFVMRQL